MLYVTKDVIYKHFYKLKCGIVCNI